MYEISHGKMFVLLFIVCVVAKRWHFYRYVRPYVFPVVISGLVHYIVSGHFHHGEVYGLLSQVLESARGDYALLASIFPLHTFDLPAILKDVIVIIGIFHLFEYCYEVYNWIREMVALGPAHFVKYCTDLAFESVKEWSLVSNEINKEKDKFTASIDADIKSKARSIDSGHINYVLPSKGLSHDSVLDIMRDCTQREDVIWEEGKVSGGIYHGDRAHINFLNEAFNQYSIANPLHTDIWPSMLKYESEIIGMTAALVNAGQTSVCGCTTSGGTESIILAIKAHRDYYRRKSGITAPEIVACVSAHAAVDKACEMLGVKLIKVPMCTNSYAIDVQALTNSITSNTVLLYSSAPSFPQGVIDPITELGAIASFYDVGCKCTHYHNAPDSLLIRLILHLLFCLSVQTYLHSHVLQL